MAETESEDAFKQVCEAVRHGKAVLWAGAGFSKYAGYPLGSEFASDLAQEIHYLASGNPVNLPDVAEQYQVQKGKKAIQEKVRIVFGKDPISLKTHESLTLIRYNIPYVVTTNYDRLFEIAYGSDVIPVVREEDVPNISNLGVGLRKPILYKPHGDVEHLDQLVITRGDYSRFDRESFLWRGLCTLPAAFSMIFIGYSMEDENARELLDIVFLRLGSQANPHFIINKRITPKDRARYKDYNVVWIEKGGEEAIEEIVDYVARYAFVDSFFDDAKLHSMRDLLRSRNIAVPLNVDGKDGRKVQVRPYDLSKPFKTTGNIHLHITGEAPELKEFEDRRIGKSFTPTDLRGPNCEVKIEAEVNRVYLFDPDNPPVDSLVVSPQPHEEKVVDLQIGPDGKRISDVSMKRYRGPENGKVIFKTQSFELICEVDKSTGEITVGLEFEPISDIEMGRTIYGFFEAWAGGEPIIVIPSGTEEPWMFPSFFAEDQAKCDSFRLLSQLYKDLSDIQRERRIRLHVPIDGVTEDDCRYVAEVAAFIRGEARVIIGEITMKVPTQSPQSSQILTREPVDIEGSRPECVESFEIFGVPFSVQFIFSGRGLVPSNIDEAFAEAASGAETVTLIYDGSIGELYQRYLPNPPQRTSEEMTAP